MSKELETNLDYIEPSGNDLINKELEALEQLSKLVFVYGGVEQYRLIEKSLKALEIIKKCNTECPDNNKIFKYSCYDRPQEMGCPLHLDYLVIGNSCFIITQEEYELLKEVLL